MSERFRGDDRAVSVSVGYVLNLAVATMLLSGLFFAAGSVVETERERAAESELRVVGEQLSADVLAADRMVNASSDPDSATVRVASDIPGKVADSGYTITVTSDPTIVLEATAPDVTVTVPLETRADLADTSVSDSRLLVVWDAEDDQLEVRPA